MPCRARRLRASTPELRTAPGAGAGVVGRAGAVTAIQRCGSALNTNVHFHTLVAEGVFATAADGAVRFVPAARPPTDLEVGRLLAAVRRRIVRLVRRHGIALAATLDDGDGVDGLALETPALAAIAGASVVGRVATGPRADHLVLLIDLPRCRMLPPIDQSRTRSAATSDVGGVVFGAGGAAGAAMPSTSYES